MCGVQSIIQNLVIQKGSLVLTWCKLLDVTVGDPEVPSRRREQLPLQSSVCSFIRADCGPGTMFRHPRSADGI